MPANLASFFAYIINALASLYLLVLLLRFWLPWLRADFRNPMAQGILKLTSPAVVPLRRVLPSFGRLDTATLVVAFAVQYLTILVMLLIYGVTASFSAIAITALVKLGLLTINLFLFAILIRVVLSWVAAGQHNPATAIITTLTEPVLRPFRRLIPAIGGFDLSPIFAMILLGASTRLLMGFNPLGM